MPTEVANEIADEEVLCGERSVVDIGREI